MSGGREFFRVISDLWGVRLPDPPDYGYETERDFRHALWRLIDRWKNRVGECTDTRNGFLLIRFHDTPGGRPDEAWLPAILLERIEEPACCASQEPPDDASKELDEAFGFD